MRRFILYKDSNPMISSNDVRVLEEYMRKEILPLAKKRERDAYSVKRKIIQEVYSQRTGKFCIHWDIVDRYEVQEEKEPEENVVLGYN